MTKRYPRLNGKPYRARVYLDRRMIDIREIASWMRENITGRCCRIQRPRFDNLELYFQSESDALMCRIQFSDAFVSMATYEPQ